MNEYLVRVKINGKVHNFSFDNYVDACVKFCKYKNETKYPVFIAKDLVKIKGANMQFLNVQKY